MGTHTLGFYLFVCLFEKFSGQPLPLNYYWSHSGADDEIEEEKGVFWNIAAIWAVGPGLRSLNSFPSSAFYFYCLHDLGLFF